MAIVYLQNKHGKWHRHLYWTAVLLLALEGRWKSVNFCLDYENATTLKIPFGEMTGIDIRRL